MDSTTTRLSPQPTTQQHSINRRRSRTTFSQQDQNQNPLPCPRCDSTNTKFCYYNNYNLSQPRHFCKSCRRYWTHGGTLRPIPVGGGTRNKSAPVKRQCVRPEPEVTDSVVVSDMGSGPAVDLNEAWWSGLTGVGLFGPDVSCGLGVLDWPMEEVCFEGEIGGILTSGNDEFK